VGSTGRFDFEQGATGFVETQGILYPSGTYEYESDGFISSVGSTLTN
jgi:hypothetical protein